MYCTKCGKRVEEDGHYCGFCGCEISNISKSYDGTSVAIVPNESSALQSSKNAIVIDTGLETAYESTIEPDHFSSTIESGGEAVFEKSDTFLSEPIGIGGWLLLIVLGQVISILNGLSVVYEFTNLLNSGDLSLVMDKGSTSYVSSYVMFYWTEVLGSGLVSLLSALILIAMLRKMKIFRRLMFTYFAINCVLVFMGAGQIATMPEWVFEGGSSTMVGQFIGYGISMMISYGIWSAYLIKSKRVKNTFGY